MRHLKRLVHKRLRHAVCEVVVLLKARQMIKANLDQQAGKAAEEKEESAPDNGVNFEIQLRVVRRRGRGIDRGIGNNHVHGPPVRGGGILEELHEDQHAARDDVEPQRVEEAADARTLR